MCVRIYGFVSMAKVSMLSVCALEDDVYDVIDRGLMEDHFSCCLLFVELILSS